MINDAALISLLRCAAREVVGDEGLDTIERASMGSEDFAYYLEKVPGAMIRLGCASQETGSSPLHTPLFDVDERSISIGARVLARAAVLWADPQRREAIQNGKTAANLGAGI